MRDAVGLAIRLLVFKPLFASIRLLNSLGKKRKEKEESGSVPT